MLGKVAVAGFISQKCLVQKVQQPGNIARFNNIGVKIK